MLFTKSLVIPLCNTSESPFPKHLEALPLLNAIIKESLQLRDTLPIPNSRVTPQQKKMTLGNYENIPEGVRISSFAWCLHRNEAGFPDPEEWWPGRWVGNKSDRVQQEKWFWTFGCGNRMYLGNK